jgi:YVTN family beta-propeller protein
MNPVDFAITPDGKTLYVTGTTTDLSSSGVWRIDTETDKVVGPVIPVAYPGRIAITPGGRLAYVTTPVSGVSVIDIRANEVTSSPIPVGTAPFSIAVAEDLPSVRIRCPKGESGGCGLSLQALTRRVRGRAQSTVTNAKLRSKRPRLVPLKPRHRFARRIARARTVLVKETFAVHGKRRIVYRRLKLIH